MVDEIDTDYPLMVGEIAIDYVNSRWNSHWLYQ